MRALTTSFLFFGYLFLAMTVGAFLWRAGFGVGAGVSATLGTFAVFGAVHLYIDGFGQRAAQHGPFRLAIGPVERRSECLDPLAVGADEGYVHPVQRGPAHQANGAHYGHSIASEERFKLNPVKEMLHQP